MKPFYEYIDEYRKQMEKGDIQVAYKGLMEFIMKLRVYFKNNYPDYNVSGNIYYGYMDMSYFSLFPEILRNRKLKIAIVFIHEKLRFEVWLAAKNKKVQRKFWNLFKEGDWNKYYVPVMIEGIDSILENVLVENPDFKDLDKLTKQIERKTLDFIKDIETFLSECNTDF